jgi:hypothetical protein
MIGDELMVKRVTCRSKAPPNPCEMGNMDNNTNEVAQM